MAVDTLRCRVCESEYPAVASGSCVRCFGPLEPVYDWAALGRTVSRESIAAGPRSLWRYQALLPTGAPADSETGAGMTPLVSAPRIASALGVGEVLLKLDHANPTHSFKDRVVSVASAKAAELGADTLACASTGNLGNAVAARAAAAGMRAVVLYPATVEPEKMLTAGVFGAELYAVRGSYDDCSRLVVELAGEVDWAFVNVNLRAYYAEGSKTLAFEIAEQLGWELPDRCVVPVASGSLFTKIARGFEEWTELGLLDGSLPRMSGAQAEGCSPVASAFAAGHDVCRPVKPSTIAKSLAIGNPADGPYALDLARRTGGGVDAVSDEEIRAGIKLLAETTGVFTETAGGVTTAVLAKLAARGEIDRDERVVLVITGEGLKTLDAVRGTFETQTIAPTLESFQTRVGEAVGV
jgi:threonine synthase